MAQPVSNEALRVLLYEINICDLTGFTILIYDWFITLDIEIARFWAGKSKTTIPAILFFLNRIITILNVSTITTVLLGNLSSRGACVAFTNTFTSIMVNRLMLNVRAPSLNPTYRTGRTQDYSVVDTHVLSTFPSKPFMAAPNPAMGSGVENAEVAIEME
ncbi:hypothetical protein HMN09_00377900 [Mycena chlorophos]|uniref:DUF6533 domain-containing protein n=1 Tax=Mycena chlorophos TaxID=658473 RepID=A0A8H6WIA3_MYCCL|nr:hypothetical protein HMN09_00377900 [Mycena chlorophos]